ncbi:MAG: hypothetical protein WBB67_08675 [bacterium]
MLFDMLKSNICKNSNHQRQIDPARNLYCAFEVIFLKALGGLVSIISNGVEKTDKEIDDLVRICSGLIYQTNYLLSKCRMNATATNNLARRFTHAHRR